MKKTLYAIFILLLFVITIAENINSQSNNQNESIKGFALVVGNQNYGNGRNLKTAENDAKSIAKTLESRGYSVKLLLNAELTDFENGLKDFTKEENQKNLPVVFYFAGHAFQINGMNYLLPINPEFNDDLSNVAQKAVSSDKLFETLKKFGNAPKIMILDACRNNPFIKEKPIEWVPGLSTPANAPTNSLIAFSTSPGLLAIDGGVGMHSPYTRALLKYLLKSGLPAEDFFKQVRQDVVENTDGIQIPWENTSLESKFYFWEPTYLGVKITRGDDDVFVSINGNVVAQKNSDFNIIKKVQLNSGENDVVIRVFNKETFRGRIPGLQRPEGWNYTVEFEDNSGSKLLLVSDGEDVPESRGPRHGKLFTVAKFQILVNEVTGKFSVVNSDLKAW